MSADRSGRAQAGGHKAKSKVENQGKRTRGGQRGRRATVSPARQAAQKVLRQVFDGQSLSAVQNSVFDSLQEPRDRALAGELVNGVLRWRWQLEALLAKLLSKPLKPKDSDVQLVLLSALYELQHGRAPDYAVINDAVELVRQGGKSWAAALTNAVLRRFGREQMALLDALEGDEAVYSHPSWLLAQIRRDWPQHWQQIVAANNARAPLWLRVNARQFAVEDYRAQLAEQGVDSETSPLSPQALKLAQGMDVRRLPGFARGAVSVQDAGAQLAAGLLDAQPGQRVLDLCAAPGGKACHLLETVDDIELLAVERDAARMQRVEENLQRLQLQAQLKVADARSLEDWWCYEGIQGQAFDRIMLDAPCSATGVIRRHSDIKSHRREQDIIELVKLQGEILDAAWQALTPGGELLYVTCSILQAENSRQIGDFLSRRPEAEALPVEADWGHACDYGRQLLPGEADADGFYYCRLRKAG